MTKIHQEKPKIDLFQFQIYHNHILIGLKYFTSHETWLSQPDVDKMTVLAFVKVTRCLDLTFISEYGQKTLKNSIYQLPLTNTDKKKKLKECKLYGQNMWTKKWFSQFGRTRVERSHVHIPLAM